MMRGVKQNLKILGKVGHILIMKQKYKLPAK